MGFVFGKRSQAALANCHPALQAIAARALELSTQDFTVTTGAGLCLAVAPHPDQLTEAKFQTIAEAFRLAAQGMGIVIRWSGYFRFFGDLTRFEIDEPVGGQSPASPIVPVMGSVAAEKKDGSSLTSALRAEYENLFACSVIRPERQPLVAAMALRMADAAHWSRYVAVANVSGVPPHLVALIHAMESGLSFLGHLHNGDPLGARTVHVPKGRPLQGQPPFTWEESACDALTLHKLDVWDDWSLAGFAYVLERYNGFGYRRHGNVSPYLWSFTTAYTRGKYVSDGHFDPQAVSQQPGVMALLRGLAACGKAYPWLPKADPS